MRLLILMLIFIFCMNAVAQGVSQNELDEFIDLINQTQLENDVVYNLAGVPVGDGCATFMNRAEVLGPTGRSVFELLTSSKPSFPQVIQGGQLLKFCPAYSELADEKKAIVWVLLMTAIAHFESTCNTNAATRGPYGTASGYFQLHKGSEALYDQGAGYCSNNCSSDPELASRCALGLIEIQMKKTGGLIFYKKSYWDVLRPNGRARRADDIQRALQKFSLCNPQRA